MSEKRSQRWPMSISCEGRLSRRITTPLAAFIHKVTVNEYASHATLMSAFGSKVSGGRDLKLGVERPYIRDRVPRSRRESRPHAPGATAHNPSL